MKALFIGGTGTISMAVSRLCLKKGWELYLINRGNRIEELGTSSNLHCLKCDINDEKTVEALIKNLHFDVVADFIAFVPSQLERDYRLLKNKTDQFIFISSASAYQKPGNSILITESTPLKNSYWEYSRNKIACEDYLMKLYRTEDFPVTIVRPSHTYDERSVPVAIHGDKGSWQVVKRIMEDKPVIVHGDGLSWWTVTHNSDFAKGFEGLMGNVHAIGEAVHITSDESVTWNQIIETIGRILGKKPEIVHISSDYLAALNEYDLRGALLGDKANSVLFDNSKIKRLVPGFCCTVRMDLGIADSLKNILAHPELQKEDKPFDEWCDRIIKKYRG